MWASAKRPRLTCLGVEGGLSGGRLMKKSFLMFDSSPRRNLVKNRNESNLLVVLSARVVNHWTTEQKVTSSKPSNRIMTVNDTQSNV